MTAKLEQVLLVEDDPDIRTIVKAALEMVGGMRVQAFASGAEALAAVDGNYAPQLALLDVMMPEMDGPGVLAGLRVRPHGATVPVVFLTAKAGTAEAQRLRSLGAIEVLTKPFDPMTLPQRIKEIWDRVQAE